MPRLIDCLLGTKEWQTHTFGLPAEVFEDEEIIRAQVDDLRQNLRKATVLVIDNVAQYYFAHHSRHDAGGVHMDGPRRFPQLAPPFPCAFFEYTLEPGTYDDLFDSSRNQPRQMNRIGVLIRALEAAPLQEDGFLDEEPEKGVAAKWFLLAYLFASHTAHRELWGPSLMLGVAVDPDGLAGRHLHCGLWGTNELGEGALDEVKLAKGLTVLTFPAFLAISFLHCRNVSTDEHVPSAKLNKAYLRRHGRPLVRYKTLTIEPMKQILRKQGQIESQGLAKALHICRGHFKDYRASAGLFGKHKGLFWWDMHARGALEQGAVVKDYAIKLDYAGAVDHPEARS